MFLWINQESKKQENTKTRNQENNKAKNNSSPYPAKGGQVRGRRATGRSETK